MATGISVVGRASRGTAPRNLTLALLVIAIAQLMVVLDTAIVNIALPSIQRALRFTPTGLEWVVNGYALAFGGLLLLGGRAGDLFGRRRVFVAGLDVQNPALVFRQHVEPEIEMIRHYVIAQW